MTNKVLMLDRNSELDRLLQVIESTDDGHSVRTGDLVLEMLRSMGVTGVLLGDIVLAAKLHDVGKRFVNPRILDKTGPLNTEERSEVEQHVWHGFRSLKRRSQPIPDTCTQVALLHHERLDGSGYPFGLRGSAVPFAARVVAVADVYDALVSERSYKAAWPVRDAAGYLSKRSGSEFDRRCVAALHEVIGLQQTEGSRAGHALAKLPVAVRHARIASSHDLHPVVFAG